MATAREWARKIGSYSPTALRFLKHSFNADTDQLAGLSHLAFDGLDLFAHTEEGMEGARRLPRSARRTSRRTADRPTGASWWGPPSVRTA